MNYRVAGELASPAVKAITGAGPVSKAFMDLGIRSFQEACRYVHGLPYGYNSNRDELKGVDLKRIRILSQTRN